MKVNLSILLIYITFLLTGCAETAINIATLAMNTMLVISVFAFILGLVVKNIQSIILSLIIIGFTYLLAYLHDDLGIENLIIYSRYTLN